jgi:uncharacterized protein (TIGR03435 family)
MLVLKRCIALALAFIAPAVIGAQAPSAPAFEVASVRLNKSGSTLPDRLPQVLPGGRFVARNVPIREIVRRAYGLSRHQTIEGPRLLDERVDIEARAPDAFVEPARLNHVLPAMLRALLAERFRLAAHAESTEMSVYIMEMARADRRLGPNIKPESVDCDVARAATAAERAANAAALEADIRAQSAGRPSTYKPLPQICSQRLINGDWEAHSVPMSQFVDLLTTILKRPVLDQTGLPGTYSFTLTFTGSDPFVFPRPLGLEPAAPEPDGRPLFRDALEKQLGLKLTSGRGPVERLVVDRIELASIE